MKGKTITDRENFIRALEFNSPEWVPIDFDLLPAVRIKYGEALKEVLLAHPLIFEAREVEQMNYTTPGLLHTEGEYYTDDWGCVWYSARDGILGQVVEHPLTDWKALDTLVPPDPSQQENWEQIKISAEQQRAKGKVVYGATSIINGGFFDRLQFLRGLENLLIDFATEPPQLATLMEMVLDHNRKAIKKWLEIGIDVMCFHGDIGTQKGLMMSPQTFRKYLKPAYREMFQMCRRAGVHVKYSSDGNLLEIVDDLIECGASYHDPQVGACGIDGIAQAYNGKMCAMVDIDEQIMPFCTPDDIDAQVREIVTKVGTPDGGLMLYASPTEDVPLENIEAICAAWERHCIA